MVFFHQRLGNRWIPIATDRGADRESTAGNNHDVSGTSPRNDDFPPHSNGRDKGRGTFTRMVRQATGSAAEGSSAEGSSIHLVPPDKRENTYITDEETFSEFYVSVFEKKVAKDGDLSSRASTIMKMMDDLFSARSRLPTEGDHRQELMELFMPLLEKLEEEANRGDGLVDQANFPVVARELSRRCQEHRHIMPSSQRAHWETEFEGSQEAQQRLESFQDRFSRSPENPANRGLFPNIASLTMETPEE